MGESLAVKLAEVDRMLFGEKEVPYKLYSNQYKPLWEDATVWEKMDIDGKYNQLVTGGGITHVQILEKPTPKQAKIIILYAMISGCEHFALNGVYNVCSNGHNTFGKQTVCPECGAEIVDRLSRVVGFFVPQSSMHKVRREWEFPSRSWSDVNTLPSNKM